MQQRLEMTVTLKFSICKKLKALTRFKNHIYNFSTTVFKLKSQHKSIFIKAIIDGSKKFNLKVLDDKIALSKRIVYAPKIKLHKLAMQF